MKTCVLYVHGQGGSAAESDHYRPLFPGCAVEGLDYRSDTPWDAGGEIREAVGALAGEYDRIILIANSIGAFFCMHAGIDGMIRRAFLISPVVDMERLILGWMAQAGVTETALREQGVIRTDFGAELSWAYLCYVRAHPIRWSVPTEILYGGRDFLTARETVLAFADAHGAGLTVMEEGEHWFHTPEQMAFLDRWIIDAEGLQETDHREGG